MAKKINIDIVVICYFWRAWAVLWREKTRLRPKNPCRSRCTV